MDYRITDAVADPPGAAERLHVERLVRLDGGFLCYRPADGLPEVSPLAAARDGFVNFGSAAMLDKINPRFAALWARILDQVEDARLTLKAKALTDSLTRSRMIDMLSAAGVPRDRVELVGQTGYMDHMRQISGFDIALDTWPYNCTTTTCDLLWMGVPVLSLCGSSHRSRVGRSILSAIGLEELSADDESAYVAKAAGLARDLPRLADLRSGLRRRMLDSPLMDGVRLATALEGAYRQMWRTYCESTR